MKDSQQEPKQQVSLMQLFFGYEFFSAIGFSIADFFLVWIKTIAGDHSFLSRWMPDEILPGMWFGLLYGFLLFWVWRFILRERFPQTIAARMGWGALPSTAIGFCAVYAALIFSRGAQGLPLILLIGLPYMICMAFIGALQGLWIFKAEEKLSSFQF